MLVGGIDIGGTKIAIAIANANGDLLAQDRIPTRGSGGPLGTLVRAAVSLERLMKQVGAPSLEAVGVGCCGPIDRRAGMVLNPPNLPEWNDVPLVKVLADAIEAPIFLENDCNAAALGELRFGAGKGARDLLYVTVSTGIGAGVILDRKLHRGLGDGAGELGHQTVDPRGPVCPCGNRGCLEIVASGSAIARKAREAIEAGGDGAAMLAQCENDPALLGAEHVAMAAMAGDPLARRIWEAMLDWLGIGIGNAITILAPSRVVIGGGVAEAGLRLFHEPLCARLEARIRMLPVDSLEILPAAHGADAGLYGAIAVAIERPAP